MEWNNVKCQRPLVAGVISALFLVSGGCARYDIGARGLLNYLVLSSLLQGQPWRDGYSCRQKITVQSDSSDLSAGSAAYFQFDHASLVNQGLSLANGDDVLVTYGVDNSEVGRSLASGSGWNSATTTIGFPLQTGLAASSSDDGYYLYYCNSSSTTPVAITLPSSSVEDLTAQQFPIGAAYTPVSRATFTPTSASQVWLYFITFAIKSNVNQLTNDSTYLARVTKNGVTDVEVEQQSNAGDHYKLMVVSGMVTGTTSQQTIALDVKSASATTQTTIKQVRIVTMLLPANVDFHSAVNDTETTVTTGGAFVDVANPVLTFIPASAGDYVVMAMAQHHENPGFSMSEMRFVDSAGAYWPQASGATNALYSVNERGAYDTFFAMRRVALSASPQSFYFQFRSSNSGGSASQYKGLRIFAFRADAFDNYFSTEDLAEVSTNSASYTDVSSLSVPAPSGLRDHVLVQSQYLYDADSSTNNEELADFTLDGASLCDQNHAIDAPMHNARSGYIFASGCVHSLVTNSAFTLKNRFAVNVTPAYSKESVIHVFRLAAADSSAGYVEVR